MVTDFNIPGAVFARYLAEKIGRCGAGAGPDGEIVYPDRPRDNFFIGRLSPGGVLDPAEDILESAEDFLSRLNPCSMQTRFIIKYSRKTKISINPSFLIYARVFPEYEIQNKDAEGTLAKGIDAKVMAVFRRFRPATSPIDFDIDVLTTDPKEVQVGWDRGIIENTPDLFRGTSSLKIKKENLESKEAYAAFLAQINGKSAVPDIRLSIIISANIVIDNPDLLEVSLSLVNRSLDSDPPGLDRLYDEVVFDAGFEAEIFDGFIVPYEFPSLPKSYRFDRRMYGSGVNCNVFVSGIDSERPTLLCTKTMPIFEQKRFYHRELHGIIAGFENLAGTEAIPLLREIASEMKKFNNTEWEHKLENLQIGPEGNEAEIHEFNSDRERFKKEIERFERGIRCLDVPAALRAFSLMNNTFDVLGQGERDRWRLFQIVFIVSSLPAIVGRELTEYADEKEWETTEVIWFPTGGGKTEAYLGLTVFALFFDRLRKRELGVTALYRFPLRLLSLQQFQRIVKTIAAANLVKSEANIGGEHFTVGHWIGSHGSPNQIKADEVTDLVEDEKRIIDGVSVLTRKFRKIAECPNPGCGNRGIYLHFERNIWVLQHICPECGVLPVYIVEHELYRYLPSVVIGTVDKMAVFGLQRRFANLIGWTSGYCPTHGYAAENQCEVPGCKNNNLKKKPFKDPVPVLHVQDELHLLKEDLGAFDSHYETAVIEMQKAIPESLVPWKTIAATATIEEYERHVEHLYLNRGRRFPTPGPSYERTFFAETDHLEISRLFTGVIPSGITHINAMVSILWYFHREIAELREIPPEKFIQVTGLKELLSVNDVPHFLDQYEIGLTYVLTKKAGDQMAESLDAQVGNYLQENGYPELISEVLSGGTTSDKITEVMDRIEKFDLNEPNPWKRIRSVVATSMISHGVDIERFKFITFFGMPRMTSEYIQASSRVGRMIPGIVFVCFAPARERDRSHYHFFQKYHEYLERLVEPAAINRWSRFSIDKTLPGIILGHIVNEKAREIDTKLTTGKRIRRQIPHNLKESQLQKRIEEYYGAERQPSKEFLATIDEKVKLFFQGLPNNSVYIGKRRGWKPMMSLRDTDQAVDFRASKYASPLFEILLKDRINTGELENMDENYVDNTE